MEKKFPRVYRLWFVVAALNFINFGMNQFLMHSHVLVRVLFLLTGGLAVVIGMVWKRRYEDDVYEERR